MKYRHTDSLKVMSTHCKPGISKPPGTDLCEIIAAKVGKTYKAENDA